MRFLFALGSLLVCLGPVGCKSGTPSRTVPDGGDAACATLCGPNASCAAGGACVCNPGFAGDGITCTDVAAGLSGLRWELPCGADLGGHVCAATTTMTTAPLKGAPGTTYAVALHFRGVIEQKTYTGDAIDGSWVVGGTPAGDAFNIYKLEISSPPQIFYLNAGASDIYNCFPIDYQKTIDMAAGATVTLLADVVDGHEIENVDPAGTPIIVPGVPPAPAAYNGQFIQMDVDAVSAK